MASRLKVDRRPRLASRVRREEQAAFDRARELPVFCGYSSRHHEAARNFYGDQRRLEIASALATGPSSSASTSPPRG